MPAPNGAPAAIEEQPRTQRTAAWVDYRRGVAVPSGATLATDAEGTLVWVRGRDGSAVTGAVPLAQVAALATALSQRLPIRVTLQ